MGFATLGDLPVFNANLVTIFEGFTFDNHRYGQSKVCSHLVSWTVNGWHCRFVGRTGTLGCRLWREAVAEHGGTPPDHPDGLASLRGTLHQHGTSLAYQQHRYRQQPQCEECKNWRNRERVALARLVSPERAFYAKKGEAVRAKALRVLGRRHREELNQIIRDINEGKEIR